MPDAAARPDWGGMGLVALGAVCFSTALIFTRLVTSIDALSIAFYRTFFAFLFFTALQLRTLPRSSAGRHIAHYRSAIPELLALGLAMALSAGLYTYAIQHTTAANAALLVNSAPLYVALLTPLVLGEARPRWTWPSLALAFVGVLLITDPAQLRLDPAALGGVIAGAASGFTYAGTMLIGRRLRGRVDGVAQTWWGAGTAALVLLPFALRTPAAATLPNLIYLAPMGVISLGIAYLLYFRGLQTLSAQVVSVLALLEPVSGVFIGLLLFAEPLTALGALGGGLVLAAVYLISR